VNASIGIRTAAMAAAMVVIVAGAGVRAGQDKPTGQGFSFRTGVELINVTATVTDAQGRFVGGLTADDFEVYEDGKLQTISQFESERVPVSLGLALDASGSMAGERWAAAQSAVNRFLFDLLGDQDEVFLYRFDSRPDLVRGWTSDRRSVGRALSSLSPGGGTAMYDAVSEAIPLFQSASRQKKALVVISDGNDTSSRTDVDALRQRIRETEILVYAIGIDASGSPSSAYTAATPAPATGQAPQSQPTQSVAVPSAFPGAPVIRTPVKPKSTPTPPSSPSSSRRSGDRFNADALRTLTDDSGGRTEIILSARDLEPATAGIASELSRQYFIGYSTSAPKDGRWHNIEVKVRRGNYTIRARKGFISG
jgi:Ca-activated chloride channel family protein